MATKATTADLNTSTAKTTEVKEAPAKTTAEEVAVNKEANKKETAETETVKKETLIKMKVSVIPCIGSIIFNTSFRSIIILIKYRCLSLHRMYVGTPIAQIWQNPE